MLRGEIGPDGMRGRGGSRRGCGRLGESLAPGRLGLLRRDFNADILEFDVFAAKVLAVMMKEAGCADDGLSLM